MDLFMVYLVMQVFAESGTNKIPVGIGNNPVCSQKQFSYGSFLIRDTASVNLMLQSSEQKKENKHSSTLNAVRSWEAIHSSSSKSLL